MSLEVEVINAHPKARLRKSGIAAGVERALRGEKIRSAQVNVILVDDEELLRMNREHLRHDYYTDVITFTIEEKPTGAVLLGAGFGSGEGVILSGSVTQQNIFGSGKHVSIGLNTSKLNTTYAFSYTDPYWTVDGVSRGFDIYLREVDAANAGLGNYQTQSAGGTLRPATGSTRLVSHCSRATRQPASSNARCKWRAVPSSSGKRSNEMRDDRPARSAASAVVRLSTEPYGVASGRQVKPYQLSSDSSWRPLRRNGRTTVPEESSATA